MKRYYIRTDFTYTEPAYEYGYRQWRELINNFKVASIAFEAFYTVDGLRAGLTIRG